MQMMSFRVTMETEVGVVVRNIQGSGIDNVWEFASKFGKVIYVETEFMLD